MAEKFYITTAIDYPNSKPHLGHAYEKTVADCLARWHRFNGQETFFLTGTDEHGKKIQEAAEKQGKKPKAFVDEQVVSFKTLCEKWNISYDNFIRTTDKHHEEMCRNIFQKVLDKGDIYLGEYEGFYCTGCEAYYLEKDAVDGCCPNHKTLLEKVKEESYFFRMSNYQKQWLSFVEKNPEFIYPVRRRQEIVNRVKEGLRDLSVSRASFDWGIKLKNDPKHVIYVWFDALLNYLSGVEYPSKKSDKFWPANMHVIGKDILWFHSVIWPIMLFSADIDPPKKVFVHGFINAASGEKMSKSLGNVIDPIDIVEKFGVDSVRYYLLREIPMGEDGNFSQNAIIVRHNNELANTLGNLLNRTMNLTEKKLFGKIPAAKTDSVLSENFRIDKINSFMEKLEVHNALGEIFSFVSACNRYINDKEPWNLDGKELEQVLYSVLDSLRVIAIILSPFLPETSEKISKQLNVPLGSLNELKFGILKPGKIGKKEILFEKLDAVVEEKISAREITVKVSPELKKLDLKLVVAVIEGVKIKKKHEGLDRQARETIKATDLDAVEESDVIKGYLELYDALDVEHDTHAVKNLVELAKKSGKLPTINTVVDSYNLVSIEKGLIVGAHDLDKVKGNVAVRKATGKELYIPLGKTGAMKIDSKEYVFVDDCVVLCRMDVKQGEHTKVTNETKNVFLYVQGNKYTSNEYLESALKKICENITMYCGGSWKQVKVQ
ncbi:MAG: methionine--tRNA ligase [Candidatus Diapherotrites archaeon CG11_big_fil_rev_8_21_14_0_20_37_9]|nr:MAG: methionine--tRNA ligase [Candidatus Diapherotrites archaeon CG11_big_fil_rev_8_21_14_0_20_37_9]